MREWQEAATHLLFPIKFSPGPVNEVKGFLPVSWKDRSTGFECNHWTVGDIQESYKDVKIDQRFTSALVFRWGSDFYELVAALQAAAAYAMATDGMVFDCEAEEIYNIDRAVKIARETEAALPQVENAFQLALKKFGTKNE
jgi:hypothetical protein